MDGINNPVVVRQDSNVQVISGKFLGDFQRHYDEKVYKIFDWVFETNPLAYFTALVGLSKIVRVPADVSHRDGSPSRAPSMRSSRRSKSRPARKVVPRSRSS